VRVTPETPARPKVSIGLPVYNGADHLGAALDSFLRQSFRDFELIVCDNASTDKTAEICQAVAATDGRIRYYRNPENIGGVRNENLTFHLARGEYFKLAAHDDLVSDDFIERSLEVLEASPEVELCVPQVRLIDGSGDPLEGTAPVAGLEQAPHQRLRAIADRWYMCEGIYGVVRVSSMRAVRLQANHLHSDRTVLAELALRRPFAVANEAILYRRLHGGNAFRDWRGRMAWFQPELKQTGAIRLPHWLQLVDYMCVLLRADLGPKQSILCSIEVLNWVLRSWRNLAMDVVAAGMMLAGGKARRRLRYASEGR
jgi:glycosyltransferase involved in cell wall biosynthesis